MALTGRGIILGALTALALGIVSWAMLLPAEWYDTFPDGIPGALFGRWIAADGPFNEHLIRDVGAMYLALAGAGLVAALSRSLTAVRAVAVAWIVFSAPHLFYHLQHLHGLAPLDAVGQPISLALTLVLPLPLLLPDRASRRSVTCEPSPALPAVGAAAPALPKGTAS
jgi:hypothetical protein